MPDNRKARRLTSKLLEWYEKNARDLPWRKTLHPYGIWISEIMLQQTQVATVIPYWKRWMQTLPTIQKLSQAKPERVLKLWEGLGYYSRARNLQLAAKQIVTKYQGVFPENPAVIRKLPGIGPYTTGAISSIAFGLPEPIVDGNVTRILTRIFGIDKNPKDKATQIKLWSLAKTLVCSTKDCSSLNQSLMELGATVCHVRQPECHHCPVMRSCTTKRKNMIHLIPAKGKPTRYEEKEIEVYVLFRRRNLLLQKRPDGLTNAGFWELPNNEIGPKLKVANKKEPIAKIRHNITKYRILLKAYTTNCNKKIEGKWCNGSDIRRLPISASHRKLITALSAQHKDFTQIFSPGSED